MLLFGIARLLLLTQLLLLLLLALVSLVHLQKLLFALLLGFDAPLGLVDFSLANLRDDAHGVRDVDLVVPNKDSRGFAHVVDLA